MAIIHGKIANSKKTIHYENNTHSINENDVDTSKLLLGMEIKDYATFCDLLGENTKTGKARILQMNNWKRFFDYEKIKYSNSYIILDVYSEPIPKEHKDYRNSLFVNEFKVLILKQLLKYETNDNGNIIYHTTFRKLAEKLKVISNRFFNKKNIEMIIQKICDDYDDNTINKKIKWSYQKFYSIVYRKLKDNIGYSLNQLEKDNMIKVNYYNVISDDNDVHKATKDEEAEITRIKKDVAIQLGYKNSQIASLYAPEKYNIELQDQYSLMGWRYVYYEIEIIASSDNLKRHIDEYTALQENKNIFELTDSDIKELQNKANRSMIETLQTKLEDLQKQEIERTCNNGIEISDFSDEEIKSFFSFQNGMYNSDSFVKAYNDFIEYLIKNKYD